MPQNTGDKLEAKQEALKAWAELPQNKPSKEVLPPANGGLQFFGLFLNLFENIRAHKILSVIIFMLIILAVFVITLWH